MNEVQTYLTRSDVARMLAVSPNTVTRWAREGRLPSQITLGGHHRFIRSVIEDVRERLSRGSAPPETVPAPAKTGAGR